MDDQRIIELYFARDEQAIRETENKYGKLCFQIALNVLNAREDAEECVNDTYNGLWNTIPPTRPANFRAFAAKIARNLSLKRLEYLTREKRSAENTVPLDELADILPDERYAPGIGDEEVGKHISAFLRMEKPDARRFCSEIFLFRSCCKYRGTLFLYDKQSEKHVVQHPKEVKGLPYQGGH